MNIWIFNPFDDILGEGKPQRYWTLAGKLAEMGHEVVWWSSAFSHRRKERRTMPAQLESLGFELRLVECSPYQRNVSLARIRNHRQWGSQLVRDALLAVGRSELQAPDLIVASMPPMEGPIAALRLKKHFGCKVVTDVMDAWPETLLQAMPSFGGIGRTIGNLLLGSYWRLLKRAILGSDGFSAQSETFSEFIARHGWDSHVEVCYLGASALSSLEVNCSSSGALRVVYIGAMGRSYDLDTLMKAVGKMNEVSGRVQLHIAGVGEQLEQLRESATGWGDGIVHFYGFLKEEALGELLASCDVGMIPMYLQSGVAVPYKSGDYLSASLPIINSLDGELRVLLNASRCGAFYEAGNVTSLVGALKYYCNLSVEEMGREHSNAKALFEAKFNRSSTYPKFSQWLVDQCNN